MVYYRHFLTSKQSIMKKRAILSLIIGVLCFMNVSISVIDGLSYFDLFFEAANHPKISDFWKAVFMGPTGILAILTALHIMEPRSDWVSRNHLAIAGITGFLLYVILYGLMYIGVSISFVAGDFLKNLVMKSTQTQEHSAVLALGWSPALYPILLLAYVLIHRFMKYDYPETVSSADEIVADHIPPTKSYAENDDEFV